MNTALIVWNNGESYEANKTYCIAVDPAELDDTVKLLGLDWQGSVIAIAKDASWCCELDSLDEVLEQRAFHICVPWEEGKWEENRATLAQLGHAVRERVAKALLNDRGYHEGHKPAVREIVEKVLRNR